MNIALHRLKKSPVTNYAVTSQVVFQAYIRSDIKMFSKYFRETGRLNKQIVFVNGEVRIEMDSQLTFPGTMQSLSGGPQSLAAIYNTL
jgi:hypothetical protein